MILNFTVQIEVNDDGEKWAPYHKHMLVQHFRQIEQWGTGQLKGLVFVPMLDRKTMDEHDYYAWERGEFDL